MESVKDERPRGKESVCRALVEAATRLIAAHGVGVTTREIATEARVNQGLITRYFGTKQVLFREVARQVATQMFDEVLHSSLGLEELLVEGIPSQRETLRALIQILFDPELSQEGLVLAELQVQFSDWLRQQKGVGQEGDTDLAARVFLVASVMLGSQLVTASTRAGLQSNEGAFRDLKKKAFSLFMNGFQGSKMAP